MDVFPDRSGMKLIPTAECWQLLATRRVGRLAFVLGDQPIVLPVDYRVEGDGVILRTGEGTGPNSALTGKVALEVGDFDIDRSGGWGVVVQGVAKDIPETAGVADHYLRMTPSHISGCRFPPKKESNVRRMVLPSWVPGDPGRRAGSRAAI